MPRKKVLFLCTGNSCRSQMAEGFARAMAGDKWDVYSAGTNPVGINPRAVQVMAEAGVDISGRTSKAIDPEILHSADVVVTLCGDAHESCPLTPPAVKRIHWPLEDPARTTGTEEEIMAKFREVRDEIKKRVAELLTTE
ncbi:arsenate reductase (thioredoxin) [Desulfofundulus thermobenzoicus]|uniref:Arsenate reductase n=1 Tax=Desulfofundulus thermobenzoicus TaxID=29376 RepID=A0A6N7IMB2_9FIRM|nr:arsenate reductase (thioredoxin) [Desulfofundulus thermobenzoicus]MQL51091.1 arsenate reductase (thioredoxin) [Desulfofundulus thermobenzoicus]HHW44152.1 arsenate reductase (thioredoxin) [Desulfotomaculum sp.]